MNRRRVDSANVSETRMRAPRVCDRCISKKTKCDRQTPACNRCKEKGLQCCYSSRKRKPGPQKGYISKVHHNLRAEENDNSLDQSYESTLSWPIQRLDGHDYSSITKEIRDRSSLPDIQPSWNQPSHDQVDSQYIGTQKGLNDLNLSTEAEVDLLNLFFTSVQPYYPLFRKPQLLQQHANGQLPRNLFFAIGAVSAAVSTHTEVTKLGAKKVGDSYVAKVREVCSPLLTSDISASVDDLRMLFLLALYESRNIPTRTAWTCIGHLVRLCYHYGVDQVDNPVNCAFYDKNSTTLEELESWRYLWWSTYILDCCCNAAVATPSHVDLDCLCTGIPVGTIENWTNGNIPLDFERKFLSRDATETSNTLKYISSNWPTYPTEHPEADVNLVVRIVNTAQLRAVFNLRRAMRANPSRSFDSKMQKLSAELASLRLAVPPRYLDPRICVSAGEQPDDHARRLVDLLEINITNLILRLPKVQASMDDDGWLACWDSSMESVNHIVDVFKQCNPSLCRMLDPCVSWVVFVAMSMIHMDLHLQTARIRSHHAMEISRTYWQLSKLFLEQLGDVWILPMTLAAAMEKFAETADYTITLKQASEMIQLLQRPLRFRADLEKRLVDTDISQTLHDIDVEIFDSEDFMEWLSLFERNESDLMNVETSTSMMSEQTESSYSNSRPG